MNFWLLIYISVFANHGRHLLLNTFFSMVAFGKAAGSLLVVSRTAKQHTECLDLNLPCVDGSGITSKSDSFDKFRLQVSDTNIP
jgi:hypothetical protein